MLRVRNVYTLNLPAYVARERVGSLAVERTIRCMTLSGFRPCEGAHQRALIAALTHHDRDLIVFFLLSFDADRGIVWWAFTMVTV